MQADDARECGAPLVDEGVTNESAVELFVFLCSVGGKWKPGPGLVFEEF